MDDQARRFLERQRVAHLATADAHGQPHVVPICFALVGDTVYVAIDEKPKRGEDPRRLRRVRNIEANPNVAIVADVYDDVDWSRLGFVLIRGAARLLLPAGPATALSAPRAVEGEHSRAIEAERAPGRGDQHEDENEHARAVQALRDRYPQYQDMALEERAVIAIDIDSVTAWGRLEA